MPQLTQGELEIWRQMLDFWRQSYDELPHSSHQRFYNMIADTFPRQEKADGPVVLDALTYVLSMTGNRLTVWELGGWGGELARKMIESCGDGIFYWNNIEICDKAVNDGWHDEQGIYNPCVLSGWAWESKNPWQGYDIGILSHVIEHLSWKHLRALIEKFSTTPFLYIQTPDAMGRTPHPTNWMGTISTHKLEAGWDEVYSLLGKYGYSQIWRKGQARFFGK